MDIPAIWIIIQDSPLYRMNYTDISVCKGRGGSKVGKGEGGRYSNIMQTVSY